MAKFDFDIPEEIQEELAKMRSDIDWIAQEMIDGALPTVQKELKSNLAGHRQSGDLIDSIKFTKAKKLKTGGYYGKAYARGYDGEGTANSLKLGALQYGVSAKNGYWKQPPCPILEMTLKNSEQEVVNKMQEIFKNEVGFK